MAAGRRRVLRSSRASGIPLDEAVELTLLLICQTTGGSLVDRTMWSKCRDEGLSGNRVSSSRALRLCERLPPRHRLQLLLGPPAKIAVAPPLQAMARRKALAE